MNIGVKEAAEVRSGLGEEAAPLELAALPEAPDLAVGVGGAGPPVHLAVDADPLVGDPLGADQDGAAAVLHQVVIPAVLVHVPPQNHAALSRP